MDRKGRIVFRRSLRFLFVGTCVSVAAVSPVRAVEPAITAQATQLADGTWTVQGTRVPGSRRCGEWLVRLTNARGQLSGVVSHAGATVPIQKSGADAGRKLLGNYPGKLVRIKTRARFAVTGRFSGDTVSPTFDSERCSARHGTATRHAAGG